MIVHRHEDDNTNECWNHDPMERRFNWAEQKSLQLSHFDWAEKKLDRCNWGEVSQHELKGVEMRRKRWNESWGESTRCAQGEGRWEEMTRGDKIVEQIATWCKILDEELRSSGTMMETCHSSYRQNFSLDPTAVHFLNLETSATRLARALLVLYGSFKTLSCSDMKHYNMSKDTIWYHGMPCGISIETGWTVFTWPCCCIVVGLVGFCVVCPLPGFLVDNVDDDWAGAAWPYLPNFLTLEISLQEVVRSVLSFEYRLSIVELGNGTYGTHGTEV